jgi:hypothetical protein
MAGYSGKPLIQKLGLKSGFQLRAINAPPNYFKWLGKLPGGVKVVSDPRSPLDFIHLFAKDRKEYEKQLPKLKKVLAPDGMIWVSWPKAASKVLTDVTEKVVRDTALKNGLVDVKVYAVDETWSGLKLVIPVKDRK